MTESLAGIPKAGVQIAPLSVDHEAVPLLGAQTMREPSAAIAIEPGPPEAPVGAAAKGVQVVPPSVDQAPFGLLVQPTRATIDGCFWAKSNPVVVPNTGF